MKTPIKNEKFPPPHKNNPFLYPTIIYMPSSTSPTSIATSTSPSQVQDFHFFTSAIIDEIKRRDAVSNYLTSYDVDLETIYMQRHKIDPKKINDKSVVCKDVLAPSSLLYDKCMSNVGKTYVIDALTEVCKKLYGEPSTYDIIFITTTKVREVELTPPGKKKPIKYQVNPGDKVGLMMIELGECKQRPEIPALKIICSAVSVSPLMLYLYAYILKSKGLETGILELSNGYSYLTGYCAYNRFGFFEDFKNKNQDCFIEEEKNPSNPTTLPMTMNLTGVTPEDLDEVLHKKKTLGKPDNNPFLTEYSEIIERNEPDGDERKKQMEALQTDICDRKYVVEKAKYGNEQRTIANTRFKTFKREFQNTYPPPRKKRSSSQVQEPVVLMSSRTRSGRNSGVTGGRKSNKKRTIKNNKKRTIKNNKKRK